MDNNYLTKRQRGLLTLITDRIIYWGTVCGAHENSNWQTNEYYEKWYPNETPVMRPQGVLDRIATVKYWRVFCVDDKRHEIDNPAYLGSDIYDHHITCEWKEPIGKGEETVSEIGKTYMTQDKAGRWHWPCDTQMTVALWHPVNQPLQERIHEAWKLPSDKQPYWMPTYKYTKDEVVGALKIMCETFGWEFKDGSEGTTMIMRCGRITSVRK